MKDIFRKHGNKILAVLGVILMIVGVFLLVVGYALSFVIWIYEQIKMTIPRYTRQQFLHYLASCLTFSRG